MSYTPSPRQSSGSVPGVASNFGAQRNDANRKPLPNANVFQTQDATASPVKSPVAVNTQTTLTVPNNAVSVTLVSTTNGIEISEDSTYSVFFNLPAGVPFTFDCADQKFIYLQSASGSTTVSFMFNLV